MKTLLPILATCLTAAILCGCNSPEKYASNNAAARQWLANQTQRATINVSGTWHSDDWGSSYFTQTGRTVTGHLGNYPVKGVVSGNEAYLTVESNGWVYYTAILTRPTRDRLEGYYSRRVPYSAPHRESLVLVRTLH
jgi:hypothetical protein